jgi:endonuclease-8
MPEGHTVRRLAMDHAAALAGSVVRVSSPQGRFAEATVVDGRVFEGTDAKGKHLFHEYEGDLLVHVHLGLYGKFTRHEVPPPPPRETCRMRVVGPGAAFDVVGATTVDLLDAAGKQAIFDRLGPDPLRKDGKAADFVSNLARRRITIGQALMDQTVIAGVGNVYRAEVLLAHGISPLRPSNEVSAEEAGAMWTTLVGLMRKGVRENRISGRDVYKQEHCRRCGTPVRRFDLAGRWAYHCPTCQPD